MQTTKKKEPTTRAAGANGQELDATLKDMANRGFSLAEISSETGVATSTIHDRLQRLKAETLEQEQLQASLFQPEKTPASFLATLKGIPGVGESRLQLATTILRTNPAVVQSPLEMFTLLHSGLALGEYLSRQIVMGWFGADVQRDPNLARLLQAPGLGGIAWAPPPAAPPPDPWEGVVRLVSAVKALRSLDEGGSSQLSQQLALRPQGLPPELQAMLTQMQVNNARLESQMDGMLKANERDQMWLSKVLAHERTENEMKQQLALAKAGMTAADRVSVDVTTAAIRAAEKVQSKSDERLERLERVAMPILRNFAIPGGAAPTVPVSIPVAEFEAIANMPIDRSHVPEETLMPAPGRGNRDGGAQ